MTGGAGNDSTFVDNARRCGERGGRPGHRPRFTSGELRACRAISRSRYSRTTDHFGTAAINLTGNFRAEYIIGNDGDNIINGGGGADTMWGRAGNDQYIVSDAGAVVHEEAGAGIDRVFAGVSYTLGDGAEMEIFTTTDHGGTARST